MTGEPEKTGDRVDTRSRINPGKPGDRENRPGKEGDAHEI